MLTVDPVPFLAEAREVIAHAEAAGRDLSPSEDRRVSVILDAAEALGRVAIYSENVEGEDVPIYEYLTGRRN